MVVSGALLRGLLYLGAFMIVVSAAVLVARFWDVFPQGVELAFIAAVPTLFYLTGWLVRVRLKLPQAGAVLTGIGALLAAVDLVAIYQFGGLAGQIDLDVYWLGSAILCTAVYALTAWRLPTDFFGYITLIGLHNLVLALARVLGLSWEWQIASQAALAAGQVEAAFRLARGPERWHMLARVARWWPLLLLPVAQILVLIVPGQPALGQMVVFVLAALGYGLLAWRFPRAAFAHVAAWSAIPAAALALRAASLPAGWYGAVAALLAPLYGLAGRWIGRRMKAEQPAGEPLARRYAAAADGAGFGLVALAASWSASSPPR